MTDVPDPATADHEFLKGVTAAVADEYTNGNGGEASRRFSLLTTHLILYGVVTIVACWNIALALNFFGIKPAFNQYNLSKIMAVAFTVLGVAELVSLNVMRNLRWLRAAMAWGVTSNLFYGGALATFYFQTHSTSLQLPIMYFGLAAVRLWFLVTGLLSDKRNGNGG